MSVQIATNLEIDKTVHLVVKDSVHVKREVVIAIEILVIETEIESEIIDVDIEAEVVHLKIVIEDHIQYLHHHRQCHHVEISESNNNNFIS